MSMKPALKYEIQAVAAYIFAFLGLALICVSLFIEPVGEIHPSVIAAFGEMLTFCGACLGLDYHYKSKSDKQ